MTSSMKFTHRLISNPMILCKLAQVSAGKRSRRSRRVRGYQPRRVLTHGTSPAASPGGGACSDRCGGCYRTSWRRWNAWEGSGAHHGSVELVGEAGDGREEEIGDDRAAACRARRRRLRASQLGWLEEEIEKTTVKLWDSSVRLQMASLDGDWAWPGLGFQLLQGTRERRRTTAPRAYPLRRSIFYRPPGAAAFIGSVHEAAANRVLHRAPPSSLLTRGWRRRNESVSWLGRFWSWAGLIPGSVQDCGLVSASPLFFCFFLFFIFCFLFCYMLTNIWYFVLQV
jgi:hypothetical protein